MRIHELNYVQNLPCSLDEAWDFFSNPANLARITPPEMGFVVTSATHGDQVYAGQIITYKVRPLWGIAVTWMTEITHVEPGRYFVDEQRVGPYTIWHHQHHFRQTSTGIEMRDTVHYVIPLGILGSIMNAWVVRKKLSRIFAYRKQQISLLFPER